MRERLKRHDWKSCRGNTLEGSNPSPSASLSYFLLVGLVLLAFANAFHGSDFIRDDRYIIADNPLLRSWSSLPTLLKTGYWEAAMGAEAPVQEFRPLVMLTYFLSARLIGFAPWIFRCGNILLHAVNTILILLLLRRRCAPAIALAAAALFAVLPVHVEAVAYITGRSELLVTFFLLLSWLELDRSRPRAWAVFLLFGCALFSKEQAVLFPLVLLLDDWSSHKDLEAGELARRYLPLLAASAAYMTVRASVLSRSFHGGQDYFEGASYPIRVLTMARFAWIHYAVPSVSGLGLQSEFVRPFFRDSSLSDPAGWLAAAGWILIAAISSAVLLKKRARWSFWIIAGFIWLLPVSNLIIHLDTIGAERFLYLPSIGLCAVIAALLGRLLRSPQRTLAVSLTIAAWFTVLTVRRNRVWASPSSYYETAVRDNPLSARAYSGLGTALVERGEAAAAKAAFERSLDLDNNNITAYYNLARLRFDGQDWISSERFLREALSRDPASVDSWVLLGIVEERRSHRDAAVADLRKAVELQSWNIAARFNLGRLYLELGRPSEAAEQFRAFLSLAPADPQAAQVRGLLSRIKDSR